MLPYYNQVKTFFLKHHLLFILQLFYFGIIVLFFHWLWWNGGLNGWLSSFAFFPETEKFLAHQVYIPASWIVKNILAFPVHLNYDTLYFSNNGYITVEAGCSGLKQFYQWVILMILFPGLWKRKLWYIPAGILTVHLYNILRIVILSIVVVHWPANWDFVHFWVMRPLYYGIIFLLWVLWIEKIGKRKSKCYH